MSVPMPPTLAPYAVHSSKQVVKTPREATLFFSVRIATEMAIGINISVVAVLEIHIDNMAEVMRDEQVIIAHSDTVIEANDHVILFLVDKKYINDVERLFQPSAFFFG